MSATEFDVFAAPLDGSTLVEASAGTGKTWTLCGLYLRLLLEQEREVPQVLVVTFTTAATAELRERVRERLVQTLAVLRGEPEPPGDPFVPTLIETLRDRHGIAADAMQRRLDAALQAFDEAAIHTIHGFCQRALGDAPLAAGMPLALEVLPDDGELRAQAVNDFWRRHVAGAVLAPALAASLLAHKDSPAAWSALLKRQLAKPLAPTLWPAAIDAEPDLDSRALQAAHAAARTLWQGDRNGIVSGLLAAMTGHLNATTYKPEKVQESAKAWDTVLNGTDPLPLLATDPKPLQLLASATLAAKTNKNKVTPQHPFFDAAQTLLDAAAALSAQADLARLRLLRRLFADAGDDLRAAKRRQRVVTYDDMLANLHQRLHGAQGEALAAALRLRYPVALIDEFQDTDPLQYAIFDRLYGAPGAGPVFLVGDPKQAIYSFRNADLATYLRARARAGRQATLAQNQRSSAALIDGLNALFQANPQVFMLSGLDYQPVGFGAKPRKPLADASLPRAALHLWRLPAGDDGAPLLKADATAAAASACAGEIARLLAAARRGEVQLDGRPLRAGDIAVLVRSHRQGSRMRQALAALGVGSVEISQQSVYASTDAEELERLLGAILEPQRTRRLLAALATELMGWQATALEALAADEPALQAWMLRFAGYRELWLRRGVGFMLRQFLHAEAVAERALQRADGERRLTNLLHLAELLHQEAQDGLAPEALLQRLQQHRADDAPADATQLRLESDRNLVQIVTIHKAKGLEFPFVFCPYAWDARAGRSRRTLEGAEDHDEDGRALIDFRQGWPDEFDEAGFKQRTRRAAAEEDLRLLYVALTRAVHRCHVVVGCYNAPAGKSVSSTESRRSLLNWLVAGAAFTPEEWFKSPLQAEAIDDAWGQLADGQPAAITLEPLPLARPVPLAPERPAPESLAALPPPARIPPAWRIGSYSGLTQGITHEAAAADHDLRAPAAPGAPAAGLDDDDILNFPRGADAGVCLHALFERVDFTQPAGWPAAIDAVLRAHPQPAPAGAPLAAMLQRLLRDVLNRPLPVGTARPLRLADVGPARRLTELEFHLPTHGLDAGALNAALAGFGYRVPRLAFGTLQGFLKGFIDLVVEHEGRYFVLDWKSNHLGHTAADYAPDALAAVMDEQAYQLQALLYGVALDRLLRQRLPGYRPEQHFGGAIYLFVRGLRPGWQAADGTPAGLHFHRPAPAVLARLAALLDATRAAA